MLSFASNVVATLFCYLLFVTLHDISRPAFVPANVEKLKRMDQLPLKYMHLLHAVVVSLVGLLFEMNLLPLWVLYVTRPWSWGFFLFDTIKTLEGDSPNWPSRQVAFHHIVTVIFITGFPYQCAIEGALSFFLSEIPVACISYAWLLHFHDQYPECQKLLNVAALLGYVAFRVVGYPWFYFRYMVPRLETDSSLYLLLFLVQVVVYGVTYYVNIVNLKDFTQAHVLGLRRKDKKKGTTTP